MRRVMFFKGKRGDFIGRLESGKIILPHRRTPVNRVGVYWVELDERERYAIARVIRPAKYVVISRERKISYGDRFLLYEDNTVTGIDGKLILNVTEMNMEDHGFTVDYAGTKEEFWVAEQTEKGYILRIPLVGLREEDFAYMDEHWEKLETENLRLKGDPLFSMLTGIPTFVYSGYYCFRSGLPELLTVTEMGIDVVESSRPEYVGWYYWEFHGRSGKVENADVDEMKKVASKYGIELPHLEIEKDSRYLREMKIWETEFEKWKKKYLESADPNSSDIPIGDKNADYLTESDVRELIDENLEIGYHELLWAVKSHIRKTSARKIRKSEYEVKILYFKDRVYREIGYLKKIMREFPPPEKPEERRDRYTIWHIKIKN